MSLTVEELGRKLLGEVEECTLNEFLANLRVVHDPSATTLNVPPLDRAHAAVSKLLSSLRKEAHHPVVEITSSTPGSGKTHLLYSAVAAAVLPPAHCAENDSDLDSHPRSGGKNGAAVVLDNDGCFDVQRLAQVMRHQLLQSKKAPSKQANDETILEDANELPDIPQDSSGNIEATITYALKHVHIFLPQSLPSLIATINGMATYLSASPNESGHHSQHRALELVAIDGVAAFFWQTMHTAEEAVYASVDGAQNKDGGLSAQQQTVREQYSALVVSLRTLHMQLACPILATNIAFTPLQQSSTAQLPTSMHLPSYKPLLPAVWTNFCTLRIVVQREEVKKFAAGMTLQRALADREMRSRVVEQGKFTGYVDGAMFAVVDGGVISREVEQSLRFVFRISTEGVDFE